MVIRTIDELVPAGLLILIVSGAACPTVPPNTPGATACENACPRLQYFECPEGDPSPARGVACTVWCENYHNTEYMPAWSECVAKAESVQDVQACGLKCAR